MIYVIRTRDIHASENEVVAQTTQLERVTKEVKFDKEIAGNLIEDGRVDKLRFILHHRVLDGIVGTMRMH